MPVETDTILQKRSAPAFLTGLAVILGGAVLSALLVITVVRTDFDLRILMFLNKFAGKSPLLDRSVELLSDTVLLTSIPLVALLWHIWFKDKRAESRIALFKGGVAAGLAGLLSRSLQLALPFHVRPLYNADLEWTWPIGMERGGGFSNWSSFPSDHASLLFALATLIWISGRRLGVFAFLWALIASCTRIYLGFHYPTDILGGMALGIFIVTLSQGLPSPRVVYRLLDWERYASPSFYTVAFLASYQVGTLFSEVRAIANLIRELI